MSAKGKSFSAEVSLISPVESFDSTGNECLLDCQQQINNNSRCRLDISAVQPSQQYKQWMLMSVSLAPREKNLALH